MKKYNLLKVIGITILVAWLMTFFIPGSQMDYSNNIVKGEIAPVGIWNLLSNVSVSLSYFSNIAIFLVAIAIFYGILSSVEAYNNFVTKTAEKFHNKLGLLVTTSVLFFGILSIFVSDSILLLVFVPFVFQVMKKLNIDSKAILSSTIVASLIGSISRLYDPYLFKAFSLNMNTLLLVKIIVLVLNLFALIILITPKKNLVANEAQDIKKASNDKPAISSVKQEAKTSGKSETKKTDTKKASAKKSGTNRTQPKKKTSGRGKA